MLAWLPTELYEVTGCRTVSSDERQKLLRSLCFNKDVLAALAFSPFILYLAFIAPFFVNYYKTFRLPQLLLMLFNTTDSISFCKKHWLMQKVWTFPSLPHLPLNSFLTFLMQSGLLWYLWSAFLLPSQCCKTRIFPTNQCLLTSDEVLARWGCRWRALSAQWLLFSKGVEVLLENLAFNKFRSIPF